MEKMPERIDSRFRFVLLAAKRAEQLMQGAPPKLEVPNAPATRMGMKEIEQGLVEWDYGPAPAEGDETAEDTAGEAET